MLLFVITSLSLPLFLSIYLHFSPFLSNSSSQVTNGKNAMPAFGGRLDDDEITNVAAYVYDQSTNSKWD